jgi:hypothetical protein
VLVELQAPVHRRLPVEMVAIQYLALLHLTVVVVVEPMGNQTEEMAALAAVVVQTRTQPLELATRQALSHLKAAMEVLVQMLRVTTLAVVVVLMQQVRLLQAQPEVTVALALHRQYLVAP